MIYNIFSKIMVNKLNPLLDNIVSNEQGAFIRGWNLQENITLAQELLHSINAKVWGDNVIIKVDMTKTYDQLE